MTARRVGVTDMRTIDEFGVVAPLRRVLDRVARDGAHLHVSLDIDFLDPSIAPGVGTPPDLHATPDNTAVAGEEPGSDDVPSELEASSLQ